MKEKNYDAFLVPRGDVFSGEEVPENEERLKYISNFSGSAGYAIISSVTKLKSAIFSDGRYKIQLKKEINSEEFNIFGGGIKEAFCFFACLKILLSALISLGSILTAISFLLFC